MFGLQRTERTADKALTLAENAQNGLTRIETRLESHVDGCERIARELREDLKDWRRGVGERFDRQDRLLWCGLVGILMTTIAVVGYLLDKSGVFAHIVK